MQAGKGDDLASMPRWQQMQYKSFRAWCNYNLPGYDLENLSSAFNNGLILAQLIENISGEKVKGIKHDPKLRIHYINNLFSCFNYLRAVPIVLHNTQPEDVADGNIKLILGLIWMLILHYQIKGASARLPSEEELAKLSTNQKQSTSASAATSLSSSAAAGAGNPRAMLLARVNNLFVSRGFKHEVTNFTSDWQDGLAFLAMIFCADPQVVNLEEAQELSPLERLKLAIRLFSEHWGLPRLLDADDMVAFKPDEKAVMTYISLIFDKFDSGEPVRAVVPEKTSPIEPKPEKQEQEPEKEKEKEEDSDDDVEQPHDPVVTSSPEVSKEEEGKDEKEEDKEDVLPTTQEVENNDEDDEPPIVLETAPTMAQLSTPDEDLMATPPPQYQQYQYQQPQSEFLMPQQVGAQMFAPPVMYPYAGLEMASYVPGESASFGYNTPPFVQPSFVMAAPWEMPAETGDIVIKLRVAGARDLRGSDLLKSKGKSDPYCEVRVPGSTIKKQKTPVIKKTLKPEWNSQFLLKGGITRESKIQFSVFDWDLLTKNDLLGTYELAVKDLLADPIFDKWVRLKAPPGKNSVDNGDLHITLAVGAGAAMPPIEGKPVKLRITGARGLMAGDTSGLSDPYVSLTISSKPKQPPIKTPIQKATLNPTWNHKVEFHRGELGSPDVTILKFDIFDWDRAGSDDPLGVVYLPLAALTASDGIYDSWLPVTDGTGELHIQAACGENVELPPKPIASQPVHVRIGRARNLLAADKSGFSDPFVQLSIAGCKKLEPRQYQTSVIKKTLNPVWNVDFLLPEGTAALHDTLQFDVFDWDAVSQNDPLGYCQLPLESLSSAQPVIEAWLPLFNSDSGERAQGELQVVVAMGEGVGLPPVTVGEQLLLRVAQARDLKAADKNGRSDPYCTVTMLVGAKTNVERKTNVIKKTLNPLWNAEFYFAPGEIDATKDILRFRLFDKDIGADDSLGYVDLPLRPLEFRPVQDLWLPVTLKHKKKGEIVQGQLHVQLAYGPAVALPPPVEEKDDDDTDSESESAHPRGLEKSIATTGHQQVKTKTPKNKISAPIKIRVVAALNLKASDLSGSSDPYCIIEINGAGKKKMKKKKEGKKRLVTKTLKKTLNPMWDEEFDLQAEQMLVDIHQDVVTFTVMDWDRIGAHDELGQASLSISELVQAKTIEQWLPLETGEIKVVASYDCPLPNRPAAAVVEGPLHKSSKKEKPAAKSETDVARGTTKDGPVVRIRVVAGKKLKAADRGGKSDPYCVISIEGKNLPQELKTKTIKETVNPVWNDDFTIMASSGFDPHVDKLRFALFDWDRFGSNDPLGCVWVEGKQLLQLQAEGKEQLDKWFPVMKHNNPKSKGDGELYLQISYIDPSPSTLATVTVSESTSTSATPTNIPTSSPKRERKTKEKKSGDKPKKKHTKKKTHDHTSNSGETEKLGELEGEGPVWTVEKTFWVFNKEKKFKASLRQLHPSNKDGDLEFALRIENDSEVVVVRKVEVQLKPVTGDSVESTNNADADNAEGGEAEADTKKKTKKKHPQSPQQETKSKAKKSNKSKRKKQAALIVLKKEQLLAGASGKHHQRQVYNTSFAYPRPAALAAEGTEQQPQQLVLNFRLKGKHVVDPLSAAPIQL
eukprot:TRINITY_DN256_c1_g1_i2.p1 TRINITY_DN256_c1_g1~~TRINITY_DN256_c1_g1_i2.p1  ORF type:complete len:1622 (-),score=365.44 TRINITY_DN256_c1_g1_i2:37-4902(-)